MDDALLDELHKAFEDVSHVLKGFGKSELLFTEQLL